MADKKVMLIGIDGAIPNFIEKFCEEGSMPNVSKLKEKGSYSKMISQIPVATPINWASITTGAAPGTHEVTGFWSHKWGERIDKFYSKTAFTNSFVKAERIWEAAARSDKRSVLLKFPGSWPSSVTNGVQVDGYCIPSHGTSVLDLCPNQCYSTKPLHKANLIQVKDANNWDNISEDMKLTLETQITITPKGNLDPVNYQLLIYGEHDYNRLMICKTKNTKDAVADLAVGQWSNWIYEEFGEVEGTIHFKLMELSKDGKDIRLYHSQVYPTSGFSKPEGLSGDLISKVGPFVEFVTPHAWKYGWVDIETCYEEAKYQIDWMIKATKILLKDKWDLFITQMHWVDHIQHYFLPFVDPESILYDEKNAEQNWEIMRKGYQLVDHFVGELVKIGGEDVVYFILSDHGNISDDSTIALLPLFVKEGLISKKKDENGKNVIDWDKTRAYPCLPGNLDVYVNLKGRDENGIVEKEEYEEVRDEIINVLSNLKDSRGKHAFGVICRSEDAATFGLYGEQLGDVVAVYNPGFSWSGHGGEDWDREDIIFADPDPEGFDYLAHHGPGLPTASTKTSTNLAFLLMYGPGVKEGYERNIDRMNYVKVLDVAPTISYFLDCATPEHNQGAVLNDFIE